MRFDLKIKKIEKKLLMHDVILMPQHKPNPVGGLEIIIFMLNNYFNCDKEWSNLLSQHKVHGQEWCIFYHYYEYDIMKYYIISCYILAESNFSAKRIIKKC